MKNPTEGVDEAAATVLPVSVTEDDLIADIRDGRKISVPLTRCPRLLSPTPTRARQQRLIAGGHGVHWPDLDEDLSGRNIVLVEPSGDS